ncbi:hypothetical protein PR048_013325 [Dryococelus australis]|uniref:Uncharacterized protein n=1 Tax=Dryococelus australis TaxID=614101 RepID=A0ABQ9HSL3_9NEOP|nr:hypothetical protein PR048_013325 [Dryococelus australis]
MSTGKRMDPCECTLCICPRKVAVNHAAGMEDKMYMHTGINEANTLYLYKPNETHGQSSTLVCSDPTGKAACCERCHCCKHDNCTSSHELSSFTQGFLLARHTSLVHQLRDNSTTARFDTKATHAKGYLTTTATAFMVEEIREDIILGRPWLHEQNATIEISME